MSSSRYVHIQIKRIYRETDKAFGCIIRKGNIESSVWIPKSQIANAEDYNEGDEDITLSITEFIANEKNLDTEES